MSKVETIEVFYERKYDFIPDNLRKGMGHFNIFKLEPFSGNNITAIPSDRQNAAICENQLK